jgi:hypothetical protein
MPITPKLRNAQVMYEKGHCLGIRCERCPLTNPAGVYPCRWVGASLAFIEPRKTKAFLLAYMKRNSAPHGVERKTEGVNA